MNTQKFKVSISIEHKTPPLKRAMPKEIPQEQKACNLLEKVQDYAQCVDSDEDSAKEWYYLQKLYEKLQDVKKLTPEQEQIVYIIEPLILKYNTNAKEIDGSKMLRGKDYLSGSSSKKDYLSGSKPSKKED